MGVYWSREKAIDGTVLLANGRRLGVIRYRSSPVADQFNIMKAAARNYDVIYVVVIGTTVVTPDRLAWYEQQEAGVYIYEPAPTNSV